MRNLSYDKCIISGWGHVAKLRRLRVISSMLLAEMPPFEECLIKDYLQSKQKTKGYYH